jgi:hypothetical protein
MFSKSAHLVGKNVMLRGKEISTRQLRFSSSIGLPINSSARQNVLTTEDVDKLINSLPVHDENKSLIEKLQKIRVESAGASAAVKVDVQPAIDTLSSFLTRFENFKKEVSEADRAKEVQFLSELLNSLEKDQNNFRTSFTEKIKAMDLMHHIVLQSVMRPGGNHCPDEYFTLLFRIVNYSIDLGLNDSIWGFDDGNFNTFYSGKKFSFLI